MGIDGFSLRPLARELDRALAGGRIDRVYQPNAYTLLLSVRQPGRNHTLHLSANPQNPAANLTERAFENPPDAPIFCMVLRKQIEDGRIAAVRQHALDRILCIDVDLRGAGGAIVTKTLVCELTGRHSNFILTQDGKIVDALRKIGSSINRLRQILPGRDYILPPHQDRVDILSEPAAAFLAKLQEYPALPLAKALLTAGIGLGPLTAREILHAAGLPGDLKTEQLVDCDFASLADAVREIATQVNATPQPTTVTAEGGKLLAVAAFAPETLRGNAFHNFASMSEALDFAIRVSGAYRPPEKDQLAKLPAAEIAKARRKRDILREELDQAQNAEAYKQKGDSLMAYQYRLPDAPGAKEAILPDLYAADPETQPIVITLDPRLTPLQNMQAYYKKYNKLKRAQIQLASQIAACETDIRYLETIESALATAFTRGDLEEIKSELIAAGYLRLPQKKKAATKTPQPLKFTAPNGMTVYVGKNNYQNDRLTFKLAAPDDLWLHAKDIPGSHVVLRTEGTAPDEAAVQFAACLAAHFSKATASSNVPVDCAKRRHVKKPSGAKPGFVIYTNQRTLFVTPQAKEIEGLLLEAQMRK